MLDQIKQDFGSRYTESYFERQFYTRDLAYIPNFLVSLVAKPLPDMVVRPVNAEEVSRIITFASENNIAVTPRAGGSTAVGSCVPTKGGIVVDLNGLQGVISFYPDDEKVRVLPATTWVELDSYLRQKGYCVCSYPSSINVATVGGWLSGRGYGMGSIRFGSLVEQVISLEVVLPSGVIKRLTRETDPPLQWFAGSEGTLGIITEVELKVRPIPETMGHYLVVGENSQAVLQAARECVGELSGIIHNMHFNSRLLNHALKRKGLTEDKLGDYHSLAIDLEGSPVSLARAKEFLRWVVDKYGLALMDPEVALEEWEIRFQSLRIMRVYPCLLGSELLIPVNSFHNYLQQVEALGRRAGVEMLTYGHIVSRDLTIVMTLYCSDERQTWRYLCDTSLMMEIYRVGRRLGGVPYLTGFWNTPYVKDIYSRKKLRELKRRKTLLDPGGIMNPGKVYGPPLLLQPNLYVLGMKTLGLLRRILPKGVQNHAQQ
ncbi:MAG: FAD-binding oxidoreductase [Thermoanaerobacteraceae bacterium]|nr:FAD-binding oxidoreductase [Thermoanaerobacteraceae bacterium]